MNERIKKLVVFAIFILVLMLASLTAFFSKSLMWPNAEVNREFDGILFNNADGVENLQVSRSLEKEANENLIKYDINLITQAKTQLQEFWEHQIDKFSLTKELALASQR